MRDQLQVGRMERTGIFCHGNGGVQDVIYQRMTFPNRILAGVRRKLNRGLWLVCHRILVVRLAGRRGLGSALIIVR